MKQWYVRIMAVLSIVWGGFFISYLLFPPENGYDLLSLYWTLAISLIILIFGYIPYIIHIYIKNSYTYEKLILIISILSVSIYFVIISFNRFYMIPVEYHFVIGILGWILLGAIDISRTLKKNK
jgi:hypothetical protein